MSTEPKALDAGVDDPAGRAGRRDVRDLGRVADALRLDELPGRAVVVRRGSGTKTLAPPFASASANARPSPVLPPVTIALRPFSEKRSSENSVMSTVVAPSLVAAASVVPCRTVRAPPLAGVACGGEANTIHPGGWIGRVHRHPSARVDAAARPARGPSGGSVASARGRQTSMRRRSATSSLRRIRRASPSRTRTAAGRPTPL